MILQGTKKKVLRDCVIYFVKSTNLGYEDLLEKLVDKGEDRLDTEEYCDWLTHVIFDTILSRSDISLAECIENKDIMRSAVSSDSSRKEGEFYTPENWCIEGRNYLKSYLKDEWGTALVWDASCGTGGLMRTANYPQDKLFMSTLLPEDVQIVSSVYPDATVFACDFLEGLDYDQYNDMFSRKLPPNLVEAMKRDEHIVFYMNPPYFVGEARRTDIGILMDSLNMGKCALDIFHQFIYRIITLKRFYRLSKVTIGVFGPVTLYHSRMLQSLLNELYDDFQFRTGMCFKAGDFSGTSVSIDWVVGYTVWSTWQDGEDKKRRNPILLHSKVLEQDGSIRTSGNRLFQDMEEYLDDWIKPKDVLRYERLPAIKSCMSSKEVFTNMATNALGQVMTSNYVIRSSRRSAITILPNVDGCDITEENFWRCVASFAMRQCYQNNRDAFKNSQYFAKPNVEIEGYNQWLIDCLPIFLFDYSALQASYRGFIACGESWDRLNAFFPLPKEAVQTIVKDENILQDMLNFGSNNEFLLGVLQSCQTSMSQEAKDLYLTGLELLAESLIGYARRDVEYKNSTVAWDAGLAQIRMTNGLWSNEKEEKIANNLSALRARLYPDIFKFGFLMDNENPNDVLTSNLLTEKMD